MKRKTEREKFEEWYMLRSCMANPMRSVARIGSQGRGRHPPDAYYYFETRNAWDAWQARARQAARERKR